MRGDLWPCSCIHKKLLHRMNRDTRRLWVREIGLILYRLILNVHLELFGTVNSSKRQKKKKKNQNRERTRSPKYTPVLIGFIPALNKPSSELQLSFYN